MLCPPLWGPSALAVMTRSAPARSCTRAQRRTCSPWPWRALRCLQDSHSPAPHWHTTPAGTASPRGLSSGDAPDLVAWSLASPLSSTTRAGGRWSQAGAARADVGSLLQRWRKDAAPMNVERSYACAAVMGGSIYVVGGHVDPRPYSELVGPLPAACQDGCRAVHGGADPGACMVWSSWWLGCAAGRRQLGCAWPRNLRRSGMHGCWVPAVWRAGAGELRCRAWCACTGSWCCSGPQLGHQVGLTAATTRPGLNAVWCRALTRWSRSTTLPATAGSFRPGSLRGSGPSWLPSQPPVWWTIAEASRPQRPCCSARQACLEAGEPRLAHPSRRSQLPRAGTAAGLVPFGTTAPSRASRVAALQHIAACMACPQVGVPRGCSRLLKTSVAAPRDILKRAPTNTHQP